MTSRNACFVLNKQCRIIYCRDKDDSPIILKSSFITAWYPGERKKIRNSFIFCRPSHERSYEIFFDSGVVEVTCVRQIECARVFASLVLQLDRVNAGILLGNLGETRSKVIVRLDVPKERGGCRLGAGEP